MQLVVLLASTGALPSFVGVQAKAKFQEIQKAYDMLMSTSEDDVIEQLADKATDAPTATT
jgi:hypothetical protein